MGLLTSAPFAGTDLGANHDTFQFLPAWHRDAKMESLIESHLYLRHHARGHDFGGQEHTDPTTWPDITEYVQVLAITEADAAVGPICQSIYFNA